MVKPPPQDCVEEMMMERPAIHGQTRRMKLNPPSILTWIQGLLSGGQDRVDQGQDGTVKKRRRRRDESRSSWRF